MKVTLRSPNQPLKSPSFASYTSDKHIYVSIFDKKKVGRGHYNQYYPRVRTKKLG